MKTSTSIIATGVFSAGLSLGLFTFFNSNETKIIVKEIPETVQNDPSHYKQVNFSEVSPTGVQVDFTSAAENSLNSVVHIKTVISTSYSSDPFYSLFYGRGGQQLQQEASGSGVIISDDGYIATNNHVISDADKITVTLNNSETYLAKLIGTDPSTDLALLKIEAKNLPYISFANSDDTKIGEWVLAVGNPFNLTSTVTAGIVSAKARHINILKSDYQNEVFPIESFIQTDAAVNPGNSGGALVNTQGQLIGINTAIASKTGSYSGYSFAVPSNIVKKVTSDLLTYGIVQRGFIGVSLSEIEPDMLDNFNLPNMNGVIVTGVVADGAAEDAGIKTGDVILKVGDVVVNKVPLLQEQIGKFSPGDEIILTIRRGTEELTLPITLKNKDGETGMVTKSETISYLALGGEFEDASSSLLKKYNISKGVRLKSVSSGLLKSHGIPEGFIITKVDQKEVGSAKEVSNYLSTKKGGLFIEGFYPNGMKGYFGFGL